MDPRDSGGGLFLKVEPSGTRRWVQRIVIHGRRRDIGLGGLKLVVERHPLRTSSSGRGVYLHPLSILPPETVHFKGRTPTGGDYWVTGDTRVNLPDWLFWLYIPLRPVLLFGVKYFCRSTSTILTGSDRCSFDDAAFAGRCCGF